MSWMIKVSGCIIRAATYEDMYMMVWIRIDDLTQEQANRI